MVVICLQFNELEEMGFIGFSVAFFDEQCQIVGTSTAIKCFTPQLLEYLHAVMIAGKLSLLSCTRAYCAHTDIIILFL